MVESPPHLSFISPCYTPLPVESHHLGSDFGITIPPGHNLVPTSATSHMHLGKMQVQCGCEVPPSFQPSESDLIFDLSSFSILG